MRNGPCSASSVLWLRRAVIGREDGGGWKGSKEKKQLISSVRVEYRIGYRVFFISDEHISGFQ